MEKDKQPHMQSPRGRGTKSKGGAPKGNKNGIVLKDAQLRQLAYQSYCDHLAQGKGKRGWFFEHGEYHCSWETMDKYIQDTVEFSPFKKAKAESMGYDMYEGYARDSASGLNTKVNTATLQMLMRNKYGWDKVDHKETEVTSEMENKFTALMNQLSKLCK